MLNSRGGGQRHMAWSTRGRCFVRIGGQKILQIQNIKHSKLLIFILATYFY